MEIKRVIAGGLTALAAGATLALGAGAVTLGDFVQVTGNTMTSPYVVIGGNAAAEDTLAAADIGVALGGQATTTVSVPGAQGTMAVSNGVMIEGEAYKLYLGTALNDPSRKPDLTKDDLPVVLGGGTVDHKTITDVDYDEFLTMSTQQVTWSKETDWDEAALNLQFGTSAVAYTYKVVFGSGVNTEYVEGKSVTLLGKDYVFSSQDTELTNTSLTLYAAGQTETIPAGESTTVTVKGNSYTITVVGVNTAGDAATIDVNGEAFDVDIVDDNYVSKGDLNVYIKSIRAFKFPAESGSVQIFLGSEKLILDDATGDITKGTTGVDGAVVAFNQVSGDRVYEIQITYVPDEAEYVTAGGSFTDPVFGAFKIAYGGIFPGLDAASKDLIQIEKSSSTRVRVKFVNKAGEQCSLDVYNTTAWAYSTKPIHVLNTDMNLTSAADNVEEGEYFLANQGFQSFILQYVSTDRTNNLIRLKDVCAGTTFDASTTTKFFYLGGYKYNFLINTTTEILEVNATGGAAAAVVPLYTSKKAKITMNSATPGEFLVQEAPFTQAGIQGASQIQLNISTALSAGEIDTITVKNASTAMAGTGLISKEDSDLSYGVTASGTYLIRDSDADTIDIYTPEVPTPVFVAVGADPSFTSGEGVTGGTIEQAVEIKNSVSKMESEITTATLDRDVILLGGPCANSLVGTLLNMSTSRPQCGTDFVAEYPTEGVISVVSDAFGSGQKALVVAGVDRTATRDLALKVMQGTVDYSA